MKVTPFEKDVYMVEGERSRPDSVSEYRVDLGDHYGCSCQSYHFNHTKFEAATGYKFRCKHIREVFDFLLQQNTEDRHVAKPIQKGSENQ